MKIGILTGGGDCPGLNAVIRAATKTALFLYGYEVIGIHDGFLGLIFPNTRKLSSHDVSGILTLGGTILGTSNKADPFKFPVEKKGKMKFVDYSNRVVKNYKKLGLDALICIGGDGTLTVANELCKRGLNIVAVPKTIDNDLSATDVTFGFDTAVTTATEAIDKLHSTAMSHHRVMIVETMGRYAGWIALYSGVAGGGDIILIPEIPYDTKKLCNKVLERHGHGKKFSIIVVAEGAKPKGGKMVISKIVKDSAEQIRLGGIGTKLANDIEKCTGLETRATILGHVQRGGTPTAFDRILATKFGVEAVNLISRKEFGKMVSIHGNTIISVKIDSAIGHLRKVSPDCQLISFARSFGISFGD